MSHCLQVGLYIYKEIDVIVIARREEREIRMMMVIISL
jgi:hypothetical protein